MKRFALCLTLLLLAAPAWATVPSDVSNRAGPYACDGSDTTFDFVFGCEDADDLLVYRITVADGTETLLTQTTHWTAASANANDPQDWSSGGTVTTTSAYSSAYEILILRSTAKTQALNIDDEDVEDALDKIVRLLQDLAERVGRSIRVPVGDYNDTTELSPSGTAGYLYRQADGDVTSVAQVDAADLTVTNYWQTRVETDTSASEALAGLGLTSYWQTRVETDTNAPEARAGLVAQKQAWVDVTESPYNATPDVATDQSAALQAAIDAALAGGMGLLIPPGTYRVETGLVVGDDSGQYLGFVMQGLGWPKLEWYGTTGTVVTIRSICESEFRGFIVDCQAAADANGIKVNTNTALAGQRNTFTNVTVWDCAAYAFHIKQVSDATCDYHNFTNCIAYGSSGTGTGVYIEGGPREINWRGGTIAAFDIGVDVHGGRFIGYDPTLADNTTTDLTISSDLSRVQLYGWTSESNVVLTTSGDAFGGDTTLGPNVLIGGHQSQLDAPLPTSPVIDYNAYEPIILAGNRFQEDVEVTSQCYGVVSILNEFTAGGFIGTGATRILELGRPIAAKQAPRVGTTEMMLTKTVAYTIDLDDDASTDDYQFDDDAANSDEQVITIANAIPAYAELVSVQLRCVETVTGSAAMSIDVGTSSGGDEILAVADTDTANDINATAAAGGPELAATNAARSVYVNANPTGVNWSTLDAGRWLLQITYLDYSTGYDQKYSE